MKRLTRLVSGSWPLWTLRKVPGQQLPSSRAGSRFSGRAIQTSRFCAARLGPYNNRHDVRWTGLGSVRAAWPWSRLQPKSTTCQGWGRGFESLRPLQSLSYTSSYLPLTFKTSATRGSGHHLATTASACSGPLRRACGPAEARTGSRLQDNGLTAINIPGTHYVQRGRSPSLVEMSLACRVAAHRGRFPAAGGQNSGAPVETRGCAKPGKPVTGSSNSAAIRAAVPSVFPRVGYSLR